MFSLNKRVIAMTLVVATVFTNTGFSSLASSVPYIVNRSALSSEENDRTKVSRYYRQYLEERRLLLMGDGDEVTEQSNNQNTNQLGESFDVENNLNENIQTNNENNNNKDNENILNTENNNTETTPETTTKNNGETTTTINNDITDTTTINDDTTTKGNDVDSESNGNIEPEENDENKLASKSDAENEDSKTDYDEEEESSETSTTIVEQETKKTTTVESTTMMETSESKTASKSIVDVAPSEEEEKKASESNANKEADIKEASVSETIMFEEKASPSETKEATSSNAKMLIIPRLYEATTSTIDKNEKIAADEATTSDAEEIEEIATNSYIIYFDGNGADLGVRMPAQRVKYDEPTRLIANKFKKEGYSFVGWKNFDKEYADKAEVLNIATGNNAIVALKAVWKKNDYKLKFVVDTNKNMGPYELKADEDFDLSTLNLNKNGYKLLGFAYDRDEGVVYSPNAKVKAEEITSDITTLYAMWLKEDRITTTINVDGNGGLVNGEDNYTIYAVNTDYISWPRVRREGYAFVKFVNVDTGEEFEFGRNRSGYKDANLRVEWEKINLDIVYHTDYENKITVVDKMYDDNGNVGHIKNINEFEIENKNLNFKYWSDKVDGDGNIYNAGTAYNDIKEQAGYYLHLYAIWENQELKDLIDAKDLNVVVNHEIDEKQLNGKFKGLSPIKGSDSKGGLFGAPQGYIDRIGEYVPGTTSRILKNFGIVEVKPEISGAVYNKPHYTKKGWAYRQRWKDGNYYTFTGEDIPMLQVEYTVVYNPWSMYHEVDQVIGSFEPYFVGTLYPIYAEPNGGTFDNNQEYDYGGFIMPGYSDILYKPRYGDTLDMLWSPTRPGYTFTGYRTPDGSYLHRYVDYDTTDPNVVHEGYDEWGEDAYVLYITADWQANNYQILFDGNGGNGSMEPIDMVYDISRNLPRNQFVKEGYNFVGWSYNGHTYSNMESVSNLTTIADEKVVLKAVWERKQYIINYHGNGNTNTVSMNPEVVYYGEPHRIKQNEFAKTGYVFNGWALSARTESIYNDEAYIGLGKETSRDEINLYATWIRPSDVIAEITIDGNGGYVNGSTTYTKRYTQFQRVEAFEFYREGYLFNRVLNGTEEWTVPTEWDSDENLNLTVEWGRKIKYKVRYHANNGTNDIIDTDPDVEYNDLYTFKLESEVGFTRENYNLIGWSTASTSKRADYGFGETTTNLSLKDGDVVDLYAVWEGVHYTIYVIDDQLAYSLTTTSIASRVATYNCIFGEGTRFPRRFTFRRKFKDGKQSNVRTLGGYAIKATSAELTYSELTPMDEVYLLEGRNSEITLYTVFFHEGRYTADRKYVVVGNGGKVYGDYRSIMPVYPYNDISYVDDRSLPDLPGFNKFTVEFSNRLPEPLIDRRKGYTLDRFVDGRGNDIDFNTRTTTPYLDPYQAVIEARWREENYNIEYSSNSNATGTMRNLNDVRFTREVKLAKNSFRREGFEFVGWDTHPSASKIMYLDEASVSELGDTNETVGLYPVWKEKSYNIEYVEDGVIVATDTILYTEKKRLRTNQMAVGNYIDKGYNYSSGSEIIKFKSGQVVGVEDFNFSNGNTARLFGTKGKEICSVTLDANGGAFRYGKVKPSGSYDQNVTTRRETIRYGEMTEFLAKPMRQGYKFVGYYATRSDGTLEPARDRWTYDEDRVFYASWSEFYVTIRCETNGGSVVVPDRKINVNDIADVRNWPYSGTKKGYRFNRWEYNMEYSPTGTFLTSVIPENMTCVYLARWTAENVTINFDANGGTGNKSSETGRYNSSHTLTNNTFTRDGYTFVGWAYASNSEVAVGDGGQITFDDDYQPEITLYAKWKQTSTIIGTLDVIGNGGLVNGLSNYAMRLSKGDLIVEPNVYRKGYIFKGFELLDGTKYSFGEHCNFVGTKTVRAIWEKRRVKVVYHSGTEQDETREFTYNTDTTIATTNQWGWKLGRDYVLEFWKILTDDEWHGYLPGTTEIDLRVDKDEIHVYPVWGHFAGELIPDPGIYEMTRIVMTDYGNPGGIDGTRSRLRELYNYDVKTILDQNINEQDDSYFAGWTDINGSNIVKYPPFGYTDRVMDDHPEGINGTINLYGVNVPKTNAIKVTYDSRGGSYGLAPETTIIPYRKGATLSVIVPTRDGYTFTGYVNAAGQVMNEHTVLNVSTVAYATWAVNDYLLDYNKQNAHALNHMSNETHSYPNEYRLTQNVYTLNGYTYKGWDDFESAKTVRYVDRATVSKLVPIATKSIYAVWEPNEYRIRFNRVDTNATGEIREATYSYGSKVQLSGKTFELEGQQQIAWIYTDTNGVVSTISLTAKLNTIDFGVPERGYLDLDALYGYTTQNLILDANGGRFVDGSERKDTEVIQGTPTRRLDVPRLDGYKFENYYFIDETGNVQNIAETWNYLGVDEIIATYSAISYRVHYLGNDADSGQMDDQEFTYGVLATLSENVFVKDGYEFGGWLRDNGEIYEDRAEVSTLSIIENDVIYLKAIWNALEYEIAYDGNGNTNLVTMPTQNAEYGTGQRLLKNEFERTGYEFVGWALSSRSSAEYQDEAVYGESGEPFADRVTLYAKWISTKSTLVSLVLVGNGGTFNGAAIATISLVVNEPIIVPEVTRPGYDFAYWRVMNGGTWTQYNIPDRCIFRETKYVYAEWTPQNYELVYNSNNGKFKTATISGLTYDGTVRLGEQAWSKLGYDFVDWKMAPNGDATHYSTGIDYSVRDIVNDNNIKGNVINVYADWVGKDVTIHFDKNDAMAEGTMPDQIARYDDHDTLYFNQYTNIGYVFSGWATSSSATTFAYVNMDSIDVIVRDNPNASTINLYAVWVDESDAVEVTYDPNGGYIARSDKKYIVDVNRNSPFVKVAAERKGYNQGEYEDTVGNIMLAGTNIDDDIEVVAQWTPKQYRILFFGQGGTPSDAMRVAENIYHDYDDTFNLSTNEFNNFGYRFYGWALEPNSDVRAYINGEEVSELTDEEYIGLYAIWEGKDYQIQYNRVDASATGVIGNTTFTYGDYAQLTNEKYELPGMTQIGWKYTDKNGNENRIGIIKQIDSRDLMIPPSEIAEFDALYGAGKYEATLEANGGHFANDLTRKIVEVGYTDPTYLFDIPVREGNYFAGYYVTDGGVTARLRDTWTYLGDRTLVASWSAFNYKVVFDANGGEGYMPMQSFTYGVEKELSANAFTREGYNFVNWSLVKYADTNIEIAPDYNVSRLTSIDNDIVILKANWEARTYTIEYNGNHADNNRVITELATFGEAHTLRKNDYERDGYEFNGWARATNSSIEYGDEAVVGISDEEYENPFRLYATWIATKSRAGRIVFIGDGGTHKGLRITTISYVYNEPIVAPEFVRDGYTFDHWKVRSGAGWTRYNMPDRCMFNDIKYVYADWNENNYEIRFHSNNGEYQLATKSVSYEDNVDLYDLGLDPIYGSLGPNEIYWTKWGHTLDVWSDKEIGYSEHRYNLGQNVAVSDFVRDLKLGKRDRVIDLYARWKGSRIQIEFRYAKRGVESGSMPNQIATYGEGQRLNLNPFSEDGYVFAGWSVNSYLDAYNVVFADGELIDNVIDYYNYGMFRADETVFTLWGKWVDPNNCIEITYDPNGGVINGRTDKFTVLANPAGSDANFNPNDEPQFRALPAYKYGFDQINYRNEHGDIIRDLQSISVSTTAIAMYQAKQYNVFYVGGDEASPAAGIVVNADGEVDGGIHNFSDEFDLANQIFVRDNYLIASWSGSKLDESEVYNVGERVSKLINGNTSRQEGRLDLAYRITLDTAEIEPKKLHALWGGNAYEIAFNKVAAEALGTVANKPFNYGETIELDDRKYSRPGMVQVGWKYTKADGTEYRYGLKGSIVDTSVFDVPESGIVEFRALYKPSKYDITLIANGGRYRDGSTEKSVEIGYNESTSIFEEPSRTGYKYAGYYVRRGGRNEKVGNTWRYIDVTEAVASWSGIKYRIVFDSNGGSGTMEAQEFRYEDGVALRESTFTREGYRVNSWLMETSDGHFVEIPLNYNESRLTTIDGSTVVLVANWVGKRYEVEYDRNGAPGVTVVDIATYGEPYHVRGKIYDYPDHEFTGWGRSSTSIAEYFEGSVLNGAYKERETLYAIWKASASVVARLILNGNGGTFNGARIATISLSENEAINVIIPKRRGYTFSHWTIDNGTVPRPRYDVPAECDFTGNRYLYAEWDRNEYEIRYHSNNGEYILSTESVMIDDTVHLVAPRYTYNYHTFRGWSNKDRGYSRVEYRVPRDVLVEDLVRDLELGESDREINLYARWQGKVVRIVFHANSADARGNMSDQIATYGETEYLKGNEFIRDGYELSGWATSSTTNRFSYINRDTIKNIIETNPNRDVIDLYAIWADTSGSEDDGTNRYVWVTYDPNQGKVAGREERFSVRIDRGSGFTKEAGEREGHRLLDYRNEHGDWIPDGTPIYISTVAIAVWQENTYHLYYVGGDNATPIAGETVTADGDIDGGEHQYLDRFNLKGEVFTRPGYYIASWSGSVRAGSEVYELGQEVSKLTTGATKKLYALWKGNRYEIRYVGGAGATGTIAPTEFTYGDKVVLTNNKFTRPGMTQIGWKYTNSAGVEYVYGSGENEQIDTSVFDAPLTTGYVELTALYRRDGKISMTATINANGGKFDDGNTTRTYDVNAGDILSFVEPKRDGYKFVDYFVDGVRLTDTWTYLTDKNVIASWSAIDYNIVFDSNGAVNVSGMPVQRVKYDSTENIRTNIFAKDGYEFDHWSVGTWSYISDAAPVPNLTTVDRGEVILKAHWQPKKYKVVYHERSGLVTTISDLEYSVPYIIENEFDTNTGDYEFIGWAKSPEVKTVSYCPDGFLDFEASYVPEIHLYARYYNVDKPVYTVNCRSNGGYVNGCEYSSCEIKYGYGEVINPPIAYRRGYRLKSWEYLFTPKAGGIWKPYVFGGVNDDPVGGSVTVRPIWEPDSYRVIYHSNDGNYDTFVDVATFGEYKKVRPIDRERTGYTFSHWSDKRDGDGKRYDVGEYYGELDPAIWDFADPWAIISGRENIIEDDVNMGTKEINVYAVWEKNEIDISFNANGGTGTMEDDHYAYAENAKIKENEFTRDGYSFMGWATRSDGNLAYCDREFVDDVILREATNSVTLYAIWAQETDTVKMVYKGRNGLVNGVKSYPVNVMRGSAFKEFKEERYGYHKTNITNEWGREFNNTTRINESTISYINWDANSYTITFDNNGATRGGTSDTSVHTFDDPEFNLTTNGFRKGGFTFKGWDINPEGKSVWYTNNESVKELTDNDNIRLYAVWQAFDIAKIVAPPTTTPLLGWDPGDTYDYIGHLTGNFPFEQAGLSYGMTGNWSSEVITYRDHHEHIGWVFTRSDGVEIQIEFGERVTLNDDFYDDFEIFDEADLLTFYTKFKPRWLGALTGITLDANGGTYANGSDNISSYIRYKDSSTKFAEPTRHGYKFNGYFVGDTNTKLTPLWEYGAWENSNVTLFGDWDPNRYEVRYDTDGGLPSIPVEIGTYNETYYVSTIDVKKEGYKLDGWKLLRTDVLYQPGEGLINPTDVDGDIITFKAMWSPKNYTINYLSDGGVGYMPSQTATYSVPHKLLPVGFTREGYIFNGWALTPGASTGIYGNEKTIGGNPGETYVPVLNLYAAWMDPNAARGTLILYGNGGLVDGVNTFIKSYKDGESVGKITAKKAGYLFNRWATHSTTFTIPATCNWDGVLSAEAEWGRQIRYNIVYHANDGSGATIDLDRDIEYEQDVVMRASNSFIRANYKMIGWGISPRDIAPTYGCETHQSKLTTNDGANVHLYAMWEPDTFDIILHENAGADNVSTYSFFYGNHTNIPGNVWTESGLVFSGWTLNSAPNVYDIDFYDQHDADEIYERTGRRKEIHLYAIWVLTAESVLMTFHGNDGTIYGKNSITTWIRRNSIINYPTAKRRGYYYTDWLDEDKINIFNRVTIDFPENTKTIYVAWNEGNYDLYYIGVDHTGGAMTPRLNIPYTYEYKLEPNSYTKTGYQFKGWDTAEDGKVVVYADRASVSQLGDHSESVRLYTVWGDATYDIVYEENGRRVATYSMSHFGNHIVKAPGRPPLGSKYYYVSSESEGREFVGGEVVDITDFPTIGAKTEIVFKLRTRKIKYTATFKANGGTYTGGYTERKLDAYYGERLVFPATPTNGTREFKGYKVRNNTYKREMIYNFVTDTTFEGEWEVYKYDVVFNKNTPVSPIASANVVKGTNPTQRYVEGIRQKLNTNHYTLSGYTFIGWATRSYTAIEAEQLRDTRSPYIIKNGESMVFTDPTINRIDLYALWVRNRIKVTLAQNESYASVKDPYATVSYILYDQLLSDSPIFAPKTRNGYTFTGMFTTKQLTTPYEKKTYTGIDEFDYYRTTGAIRITGKEITLYPRWLNDEWQALLNIRDGSYNPDYRSHYVTLYYDEPYFTKGSPDEPRDKDGKFVTPIASRSNLRLFDYWSFDVAGRRKFDGTVRALDKSVTTIYANYRDRKIYTMTYEPNGAPKGEELVERAYEGLPYRVQGAIYTRDNYAYDYWDYYTQSGVYGSYGIGKIVYPSDSMTLSPHWYKIETGGGGPGGGGGGGSNGKNMAGTRTRDMIIYDFLLEDELPADEGFGQWTYNPDDDTYGYEIAYNSAVCETLINEKLYDYIEDTKKGRMYKIKNGIFKIPYANNAYYFSFDKDGVMSTGFAMTKETTHRYAINYDSKTLQDMGAVGVAKFYFMEEGPFKGALWNQPITLDDVTYIFDEQGRVIEEIAHPNTDNGAWEYEPEDDSWSYAVIDEKGEKEYIKSGTYAIKDYDTVNYYMFDANGKMRTGFVEQGGKIYYLQETGKYKGAVYTGPLILGGNFYDFDSQGSLVVALTFTEVMAMTQTDPALNEKVIYALTKTATIDTNIAGVNVDANVTMNTNVNTTANTGANVTNIGVADTIHTTPVTSITANAIENPLMDNEIVKPLLVTENRPAVAFVSNVNTNNLVVTNVTEESATWVKDPVTGAKALTGVTRDNIPMVPMGVFCQIRHNDVTDTYYFDEGGIMITGWMKTQDGKWYYFNEMEGASEGIMAQGWTKIGNSWYYFNANGSLLESGTTPDGETIGSDGKWHGSAVTALNKTS